MENGVNHLQNTKKVNYQSTDSNNRSHRQHRRILPGNGGGAPHPGEGIKWILLMYRICNMSDRNTVACGGLPSRSQHSPGLARLTHPPGRNGGLAHFQVVRLAAFMLTVP